MTDVFSRKDRSRIMSRIKARDTKPELTVRCALHKLGYRFRLHDRRLPGTPDIVLPRHEKVIFVHGCFWHGHKLCKRATTPDTRREFWQKKISGTIERDKKALHSLKKLGWQVLIIWQCKAKDINSLQNRLKDFMKS